MVPVEEVQEVITSDDILRQQFGLSQPQSLRSDSSSYELAAEQAKQFHDAGLPSAKLSHYLKPDALTYLPEDTFNLPEEVYHNLSGHERRSLGERNKTLISRCRFVQSTSDGSTSLPNPNSSITFHFSAKRLHSKHVRNVTPYKFLNNNCRAKAFSLSLFTLSSNKFIHADSTNH